MAIVSKYKTFSGAGSDSNILTGTQVAQSGPSGKVRFGIYSTQAHQDDVTATLNVANTTVVENFVPCNIDSGYSSLFQVSMSVPPGQPIILDLTATGASSVQYIVETI